MPFGPVSRLPVFVPHHRPRTKHERALIFYHNFVPRFPTIVFFCISYSQFIWNNPLNRRLPIRASNTIPWEVSESNSPSSLVSLSSLLSLPV